MITSIARAEWALNNTVDTYHQKHTGEKIAVKCVLRNDHKTTLLKCQSQATLARHVINHHGAKMLAV